MSEWLLNGEPHPKPGGYPQSLGDSLCFNIQIFMVTFIWFMQVCCLCALSANPWHTRDALQKLRQAAF